MIIDKHNQIKQVAKDIIANGDLYNYLFIKDGLLYITDLKDTQHLQNNNSKYNLIGIIVKTSSVNNPLYIEGKLKNIIDSYIDTKNKLNKFYNN